MSTQIRSRTAPASRLIGAAKRQCRTFVHVLAVLFVTLATMITASTAEAAAIRWTITGTFQDGGTANGYFDYDTVGQSLLGWNITMAGGDTVTFPEITLASTDPGAVGTIVGFANTLSFASSATLGVFPSAPLLPDALLLLLSDPTNVIPVLLQQCYFVCLVGVPPQRLGLGELTGEALAETPLPAALPLFATVIGLGAVLARRRKQQNAI